MTCACCGATRFDPPAALVAVVPGGMGVACCPGTLGIGYAPVRAMDAAERITLSGPDVLAARIAALGPQPLTQGLVCPGQPPVYRVIGFAWAGSPWPIY